MPDDTSRIAPMNIPLAKLIDDLPAFECTVTANHTVDDDGQMVTDINVSPWRPVEAAAPAATEPQATYRGARAAGAEPPLVTAARAMRAEDTGLLLSGLRGHAAMLEAMPTPLARDEAAVIRAFLAAFDNARRDAEGTR